MKKHIIFPHPFLRFVGALLSLLFYGLCILELYCLLFEFQDLGWLLLPMSLVILMILVGTVYWHIYAAPHIFGRLLITEKYILYFGFLVPFVKISYDQLRYVEIRTLKDGNAYYPKNLNEYQNVDMFKFILLSENPLPSKSVFYILSSKRKKCIKFAVSYKLCQILLDYLPKELNKPIDYQLYLYHRAKRKP